MRTDKTFAHTEDDWQSIKASLVRVDIDADAVTVPDRWWAHPDPAAALVAEPQLIGEKKQWVMLVKRPLREQLQELAADYRGLAVQRKQGDLLMPRQRKALNKLEAACAMLDAETLLFSPYTAGAREALTAVLAKVKKSLTPRQEAGEIQEKLKKLKPARAALELLQFIPETAVAREALTSLIAHVERKRDRLMAAGSRRGVNLYKVHIEYWGKLVLLWQAITLGQTARQRERGLNRFLLACSAPAFPEVTSKSNIKNFIKNFRRKLPFDQA